MNMKTTIQDTASSQEIDAFVKEVAASKKAISVEGYVTSDGKVEDYVIIPLPVGGLTRIRQVSHELLRKDVQDPFLDRHGHDANVWDESVATLLMTFLSSPAESSTSGHVRSKYNLTRLSENVFQDAEASVTVLQHLGCAATKNVFTPEKKASTRPRNPVVVCKEHISKQLPIFEYKGQLVLAQGKFKELRVVDAPASSWTYRLFLA